MEPNLVPPHLGWERIKPYIPLIREVLSRYPEPTCFRPNKGSVATLAGRLRDTMASLTRYNWPVEGLEKLREVRSDLMVQVAGDMVIVSPRSPDRRKQVEVSSDRELVLSEEVTFEVLKALATLLGARVLKHPVKFKWHDEAQLRELERMFDVGVVKTEDGYEML